MAVARTFSKGGKLRVWAGPPASRAVDATVDAVTRRRLLVASLMVVDGLLVRGVTQSVARPPTTVEPHTSTVCIHVKKSCNKKANVKKLSSHLT